MLYFVYTSSKPGATPSYFEDEKTAINAAKCYRDKNGFTQTRLVKPKTLTAVMDVVNAYLAKADRPPANEMENYFHDDLLHNARKLTKLATRLHSEGVLL